MPTILQRLKALFRQPSPPSIEEVRAIVDDAPDSLSAGDQQTASPAGEHSETDDIRSKLLRQGTPIRFTAMKDEGLPHPAVTIEEPRQYLCFARAPVQFTGVHAAGAAAPDTGGAGWTEEKERELQYLRAEAAGMAPVEADPWTDEKQRELEALRAEFTAERRARFMQEIEDIFARPRGRS